MKSSQFYKTTAWRWFSRFVLLADSKDGVCKCATCGAMKMVNDKKMHLGHLIKVFETGGHTNFSVAFNEKNVMPQCHKCNVHMGGCELKMLEAVNLRFGKDTHNELKRLSRNAFKLGKVELKYISDLYREKFYKVVKDKGNPWKK